MNETNKRSLGIGFLLAGLAVAAMLYYVLIRPDGPGDNGNGASETVSEKEAATPSVAEGTASDPVKKEDLPRPGVAEQKEVIVHDIAGTALRLHQSDSEPEEDLRILQNLVDFYRRVYGANPEGGLNFEIVGKLTGGNERKLAMMTPDHPSLNGEGELVDRWGTPYWFHPVSRELMEIVSAGPDKQLWTDDDVRIE